jgi:hypothetical protein
MARSSLKESVFPALPLICRHRKMFGSTMLALLRVPFLTSELTDASPSSLPGKADLDRAGRLLRAMRILGARGFANLRGIRRLSGEDHPPGAENWLAKAGASSAIGLWYVFVPVQKVEVTHRIPGNTKFAPRSVLNDLTPEARQLSCLRGLYL